MAVEQRKALSGYEKRYIVTSLGSIISLMWGNVPRREQKPLTIVMRNGRPHVILRDGVGGRTLASVAVLVLTSFPQGSLSPSLPAPYSEDSIEYLDGNVTNLKATNLRWKVGACLPSGTQVQAPLALTGQVLSIDHSSFKKVAVHAFKRFIEVRGQVPELAPDKLFEDLYDNIAKAELPA